MKSNLFVPAPEGERHNQAVKLAIFMARRGSASEAIYARLRGMYEVSVTDDELKSIVSWVQRRKTTQQQPGVTVAKPKSKIQKPKTDYLAGAEHFTGGGRMDPLALLEQSPIRIPSSVSEAAVAFIRTAYQAGELVNVVSVCQSQGGKARPVGMGSVRSREQWIQQIELQGLPCGPGGVWQRMNPVRHRAPSNGRGFADCDVAAFRFVLVESDALPLDLQIGVLVRVKLPIFALVHSGGKSVHAWVRIDAADEFSYRDAVRIIFDRLGPLGFDKANSNPSRLARLPGASRPIIESPTNESLIQRLLFLSSTPSFASIL
jgi:hypothetical protein